MGKWSLHASSFIFDRIIIKVAGNRDRHKSLDEFDFRPLVSMAHLYIFWNERMSSSACGWSKDLFLAHLSRRLTRWAYSIPMVRRPSSSSVVVVHTFKLEYLWSQLANLDQILCVASLGWGKGCIRFWGRLVYLAPHLGFGSGSVISQFLLHHYLGIFSCKRYKHYFSQTEMFTSNIQFGYSCPRGWGASCPGWFILPPAKDLGWTVSSVNSYCTKILEYLVVRDINIISVKLRCLHPTFSLVTLVRGVVQAGLSCPPPRIWVEQCHQLIGLNSVIS